MYFTFNNWEGGKDRDERDDEMMWFRRKCQNETSGGKNYNRTVMLISKHL